MKSYTNLEQSKMLAEFLPLESADSHYVRQTHDFRGNTVDGKWSHPKYGNPNSRYANYIVQNFSSYETIPCWSLAALLDVLPDNITSNDGIAFKLNIKKNIIEYSNPSLYLIYKSVKSNNIVDACVEMIEKLHELKKL